MRRFLIWSYNTSLAGLVAGKVSDDTKVGYAVGTWVGAVAAATYAAFVVSYNRAR